MGKSYWGRKNIPEARWQHSTGILAESQSGVGVSIDGQVIAHKDDQIPLIISTIHQGSKEDVNMYHLSVSGKHLERAKKREGKKNPSEATPGCGLWCKGSLPQCVATGATCV